MIIVTRPLPLCVQKQQSNPVCHNLCESTWDPITCAQRCVMRQGLGMVAAIG